VRVTAAKADLVEELLKEFGDTLSHAAIRAGVVSAIVDLRGSISPESLPEMAVRLARVRLADRVVSAAPWSEGPAR
jgi:hypothetical protein